MGIDTSGLDTETMQRVIAMAQERGLPLTPQTFNGLMELASAEDAGAATMNNGREDIDDPLGRFMSKTDGTAPVTPVDRVALPGVNAYQGKGMDDHALSNLYAEAPNASPRAITAVNDRDPLGISPDHVYTWNNVGVQGAPITAVGRYGQGPARLRSHEAEAPDARGKPIDAEDTKNTPPGMQGMNDMGLEDGSAVGGMSGGAAAMAGGGLAALIATLTKRHKPSLGQSIHLGDAMAKPAINQYEGVMTPSTQSEVRRSRQTYENGRFGKPMEEAKRSPVTGKRRKAKKKDE